MMIIIIECSHCGRAHVAKPTVKQFLSRPAWHTGLVEHYYRKNAGNEKKWVVREDYDQAILCPECAEKFEAVVAEVNENRKTQLNDFLKEGVAQ